MSLRVMLGAMDLNTAAQLFAEEKYQEAAEQFSQALAKKASQPRPLLYRAICYFRLGQHKKALADFANGFKYANGDSFESTSEIDFILDNLHECQKELIPELKNLLSPKLPLLEAAIYKKMEEFDLKQYEFSYSISMRFARAELWLYLCGAEMARCELEVAQWLSKGTLDDPQEFSPEAYGYGMAQCDVIQTNVIPELRDPEKEPAFKLLNGYYTKIFELLNEEKFALIEEKFLPLVGKIGLNSSELARETFKGLTIDCKEYLSDINQFKDPPTKEIAFQQLQLIMALPLLMMNKGLYFAELVIDCALRLSEKNPSVWHAASMFNLAKLNTLGRQTEKEHKDRRVVDQKDKDRCALKMKEYLAKGTACLKQPDSQFLFLIAMLHFEQKEWKKAYFDLVLGFLLDKEKISHLFQSGRSYFFICFDANLDLFLNDFLGPEKYHLARATIKKLMTHLHAEKFKCGEDCFNLANEWKKLGNLPLALFFKAMGFWSLSIKLDKKTKNLEQLKDHIANDAIQLIKNDDVNAKHYRQIVTSLGKSIPAEVEVKAVELQDSAFDPEKVDLPKIKAKKKKKNKQPKPQMIKKEVTEEKEIKNFVLPVTQALTQVSVPIPIFEEKKEKPITTCYLDKTVTYTREILNVYEKFNDTNRVYVVGGWMCQALSPQDAETDIDITFGIEEKDPEAYLKKRFSDAKITKTSSHDFVIEIFKPDYIKVDAHYSEALSDFSLTELAAISLDANQRDFRANALYGKKPEPSKETGAVIDGTGRGYQDLIDRSLRSVIKMEDNFAADFVRALRAIYFKSKRQWKITDPMLKALKGITKEKVDNALLENPGRVNHWILKLLTKGHAGKNFPLLHETELLKKLFPDLGDVFAKPHDKEQMMLYMRELDTSSADRRTINLNHIYATWIIFINRKTGKAIDKIIQDNPLLMKNFEYFADKEKLKEALFAGANQSYIDFFETSKPKGPREPAFTADDFKRYQAQQALLSVTFTSNEEKKSVKPAEADKEFVQKTVATV